MNECISSLGDTTVFPAHVTNSRCWKLAIDEADRSKITFTLHHRLNQFIQMPFKLRNALSTFHPQWTLFLQPSNGSLHLSTPAFLLYFWNPWRSKSCTFATYSCSLLTQALPPSSRNIVSLRKPLTILDTSFVQSAWTLSHAQETPSRSSIYPPS